MNEPHRLDRLPMAMRAARDFEDGMLVNLGAGLPIPAASYVLEGREVILHSENGLIGYGPVVEDVTQADIFLINAGEQPVQRKPGMALMSHDESFGLVRGGWIDISVLGALQVAANGDLANYHIPGKITESFGGGQDLAFCAKKVIALMTHTTRDNQPKIVRALTLPMTAPAAVDRIITDIAVIDVTTAGLVLREYVPGWTPEAIQALTEPSLILADDLREMVLG